MPPSNSTLRELADKHRLSYPRLCGVMTGYSEPKTEWRPRVDTGNPARLQRIAELKELISEAKKHYERSKNNGNGIFILDQLIQAGREYLKVATTGEEFAWLAEQIPPESATFNQLIEKWDDCMIFCIRQMETIEEIVQAYHSSPRGGGAQDYALYRIVQITLEDSE